MNNIDFDYNQLTKTERLAYDHMNESERTNFEKIWISIQLNKLKMQQHVNKSKTRYQREKTELAKKERAARTHRLVERGALLEKFIPEDMTNEEIVVLLKYCLTTDYAKKAVLSIVSQRCEMSQ